MSYYAGDFYAPRGFRRGDFWGAISDVAGRLAGAGLKRLESAISGTPAAAATIARSGGAIVGPYRVGGIVGRAAGAIQRHPVLSAAGAAATVGAASTAFRPGRLDIPGAGQMAGTGRRYRRMNVCNMRALRRSLRRIHGFAKYARKVYTVTHPAKGARHRFKFGRRRK